MRPAATAPTGASPHVGASRLAALRRARVGTLVDPHRQGRLHRRVLVLLIVARLVLAAAGGVGLLVLWAGTEGGLPGLRNGLLIAAVLGLTVLAWLQLHRPASPGENVLMVHLLGDIVLLTGAFQQTGGAESPFLVFYMLPLTLAAYALSWPRLLAAAATVGAGAVLLFQSGEGPPAYGSPVHEASELIAVALVTYFAHAVATGSRSHERAVASAREAVLNEQGDHALGCVAAQAAHSISSPLATMSVLVNELRQARLSAEEAQAALGEMNTQIARCKLNLSELLASVGRPRATGGGRCAVDELLLAALRQCELMDPTLRVHLRLEPSEQAPPQVLDDRTLSDAFVLLIQHRGRPAPHVVRLTLAWDSTWISVRVCGAGARGSGGAAACTEADDRIVLAASLIGRFAGELGWQGLGSRHCALVRLPTSSIGVGLPAGKRIDPKTPCADCAASPAVQAASPTTTETRNS